MEIAPKLSRVLETATPLIVNTTPNGTLEDAILTSNGLLTFKSGFFTPFH